jgi:hypothetical protein
MRIVNEYQVNTGGGCITTCLSILGHEKIKVVTVTDDSVIALSAPYDENAEDYSSSELFWINPHTSPQQVLQAFPEIGERILKIANEEVISN